MQLLRIDKAECINWGETVGQWDGHIHHKAEDGGSDKFIVASMRHQITWF